MDIRNQNRKGTKGRRNGYSCTGLCLVFWKCQKALLRFQKVPEGLGSLGKVLVRLYEGYRMYVRYIIPLLYMQQWCLSFILSE